MQKIQVQGVHHITIVGATRRMSIDFWEGVLGMPFVFEQPNLDNEAESHLYFDPGDGRLVTVFTNEEREAVGPPADDKEPGRVHHLAFSVSKATFDQVVAGYHEENGLSTREREAIWYVMLATQLLFVEYFLQHPDGRLVRFNLDAFYWILQRREEITRHILQA